MQCFPFMFPSQSPLCRVLGGRGFCSCTCFLSSHLGLALNQGACGFWAKRHLHPPGPLQMGGSCIAEDVPFKVTLGLQGGTDIMTTRVLLAQVFHRTPWLLEPKFLKEAQPALPIISGAWMPWNPSWQTARSKACQEGSSHSSGANRLS